MYVGRILTVAIHSGLLINVFHSRCSVHGMLFLRLLRSNHILNYGKANPTEQQYRCDNVQFNRSAQLKTVGEGNDKSEALPHSVVRKGSF